MWGFVPLWYRRFGTARRVFAETRMTDTNPLADAHDNGEEVWQAHRQRILAKHGLLGDSNDD